MIKVTNIAWCFLNYIQNHQWLNIRRRRRTAHPLVARKRIILFSVFIQIEQVGCMYGFIYTTNPNTVQGMHNCNITWASEITGSSIICATSCFRGVKASHPSWWSHQMETYSALLAICAGNSPHKGQWSGALMFYLICVWINGWVNNREAGDLRRHRANYDVTVMFP